MLAESMQSECNRVRHGAVVQASMLLNGRRALAGGPVVKKAQKVWRSDSGGLRGPAAGRAQQEARAAAAAAAAQQQLRSEADVRALVEVLLPLILQISSIPFGGAAGISSTVVLVDAPRTSPNNIHTLPWYCENALRDYPPHSCLAEPLLSSHLLKYVHPLMAQQECSLQPSLSRRV